MKKRYFLFGLLCITANEKTAVLIYEQVCDFEIALALEILAIVQKFITISAKSLNSVRN